MDSDLQSLDGDIQYAQLSGVLVEFIPDEDHDDLPVMLKRGNEPSNLLAGRLLQPCIFNTRCGTSVTPLTVQADELVLYRCNDQHPERFWAGGREYHVIDTDDIVTLLRTPSGWETNDDIVETYGELNV